MNNIFYKRIFPFYISFLLANSFGQALSNLWFLKNAFSYFQLVTFSLVTFISPLILIAASKKFETAKFMRIAILFSMVSAILMIKFYSPLQPYLISLLGGANLFYFWAAYNITHFKTTAINKKAFSSALLFFVSPVLGVILPALTGFIAAVAGFQLNFITGFFLFLIPLGLSFTLPSYKFNYRLIQSLRKIPKLHPFLLIEGFWEATVFTAIPIFTLFFIQTPRELGIYLSYIAAVAALVNLIFGRISDKLRKRALFLYPITVLLALATFGLAFADTLISWIIFQTAISVLLTLAWPFMTVLVVDFYPDSALTMVPREFLLNLGRLTGVLVIVFSLLLFNSPRPALLVLGAVLLLYPIVLFQRKAYKGVAL